MRLVILMTAAVSLVLPALAQNADAHGVVNEPAVQNAIRGALDSILKVPVQPAGSAVAPPPRLRIGPPVRLLLPPRVCAVPLLAAPANGDTDPAIVLKSGPAFDDSRMILTPPVAPCPSAR